MKGEPVQLRLEDYNFYQENAPPHRVIRGYPAKGRWPSEHEEEDLLEADSSNKKVPVMLSKRSP